jgi:hypothetical protein
VWGFSFLLYFISVVIDVGMGGILNTPPPHHNARANDIEVVIIVVVGVGIHVVISNHCNPS